MNWDRIEGDWKKVKGTVRERWGRLSDDHLERIAGTRDLLVGGIQQSYGIAREEAERQVMAWEMRNAFLDTGQRNAKTESSDRHCSAAGGIAPSQ
ncbi:MAG: CsbD family protein [Burkholderiales bacterium]|nr:CsbD family protein [Burkholderiales bacterium]